MILRACTTTYRLDADNKVSYVSSDWVAFARRNNAPELAREDIIGRPISDFIAGSETAHLYELIYKKLRANRGTVTLPFRCDSPDKRRFMEIRISLLADGELEITSRSIREEPRTPVSILEKTTRTTQEYLTICSWCKRVRSDENQWSEIEDAVRTRGLFNLSELPQLTHGICPRCKTAVLNLLADNDEHKSHKRGHLA